MVACACLYMSTLTPPYSFQRIVYEIRHVSMARNVKNVDSCPEIPERTSDGLSILAYVNSSFTPGGEWTKYIAASWSQKWSNNFVVQWCLWASTRGGEWRIPEWEIDEIPNNVRMKCIRTSEYVLRAGRIMRSALFIAHSVGLPSLVASSMMRSTNGIWFYLVGCFIVYLSNPSRMSIYHFGGMCSFNEFPA